MIRGGYTAVGSGWVVYRPMVGDVITIVDHWGSIDLAVIIARIRNANLLWR